MVSSTRAIVAW